MTQNSAIQIFNFEANQVRVVFDDHGEPWWVAGDVCKALGLENTSRAVSRLLSNERGIISIDTSYKGITSSNTPGNTQHVITINESGLYKLVLGCRKPEAERFKTWVTSEVLPQIRKTGGYNINKPALSINARDPLTVNNFCLALAEYNKELQAELEKTKPKVDFYDQFTDANGQYGLQNAGRCLGLPPRKFIDSLQEYGYLFREGGQLIPKSQYIEQELFTVKTTLVDNRAYLQTFVTPKGLQYLARQVDADQQMMLFVNKEMN